MSDQSESTMPFADRRRPGVFVVPSLPFADNLLMEAATAGLTTARLDLSDVRTKAAFLAECARRLDFPPYFGHNWDAFDECFRDLAWQTVPGHAFLFAACDRFAAAAPDDWRIALRIFESAVAEWEQAGKPLYVFLQSSPPFAPGVPTLPADDDVE